MQNCTHYSQMADMAVWYLNTRASQVDVGFPLSFHAPVLVGLGMHKLFAIGCADELGWAAIGRHSFYGTATGQSVRPTGTKQMKNKDKAQKTNSRIYLFF